MVKTIIVDANIHCYRMQFVYVGFQQQQQPRQPPNKQGKSDPPSIDRDRLHGVAYRA